MTAISPDSAVQQIDPRTLLLDRNLRLTTATNRDLVASIKDHGVLIPIVAVQAADGIRVRHGHRRTLAAIDAGLPTVPVLVIGEDADTDKAHIARLLAQWAENEHRAGLTDADKVTAVEQLAAFGLSPASISRRTRTPREQVAAALTVAASPAARGATDAHHLDLAQAATIAEFDGDADAVSTLLDAARTGDFDHAAQRLRDDRTDRAARDRAAQALRDSGILVLDRADTDSPVLALTRLTHDGTPLTAESHGACPGHAAYLLQTYRRHDNAEDGGYVPVYVCTDPGAHGHTDRNQPSPRTGSGTSTSGALARAQRATVVESNKSWRAATTVRRAWLRTFSARRTPPSDAARFVAARLAGGDPALSRALSRAHPLATELLGTEADPLEPAQLTAMIGTASEPRAQMLVLVLVLAAYEDTLDVHTWRFPIPSTRRYLATLEQWGYTLAPIERTVAHSATASEPNPADTDTPSTEFTPTPDVTESQAAAGRPDAPTEDS